VNSEIIAALNELRNEVHALRFDLKAKQHDTKTPRKLRHELRCKRICDLAAATGLGITWPCVVHVLSIINGDTNPPTGQEQTALKLRQDAECPKTAKTIWTIINLHHLHPVA
jgi:hypothetical protein